MLYTLICFVSWLIVHGATIRDSSVDFDESSPDEFDSANPYEDPVSMLDMREHTVREKWIDIEKAKIIREKLYWCYCIEGVNHLQKYCHLFH
ncbi:PREDICTED: NADH dehydrogenase [Prunus dulcis]|uniref:PREDICTED: NADH dehydrogenase n=1 Tax=Prunus dulcis TaxID=3755 RepID=A0A5E4GC91_PRUDU|nr:PREDICTED: NADH dehydrogenase [Prunus dulcis]